MTARSLSEVRGHRHTREQITAKPATLIVTELPQARQRSLDPPWATRCRTWHTLTVGHGTQREIQRVQVGVVPSLESLIFVSTPQAEPGSAPSNSVLPHNATNGAGPHAIEQRSPAQSQIERPPRHGRVSTLVLRGGPALVALGRLWRANGDGRACPRRLTCSPTCAALVISSTADMPMTSTWQSSRSGPAYRSITSSAALAASTARPRHSTSPTAGSSAPRTCCVPRT